MNLHNICSLGFADIINSNLVSEPRSATKDVPTEKIIVDKAVPPLGDRVVTAGRKGASDVMLRDPRAVQGSDRAPVAAFAANAGKDEHNCFAPPPCAPWAAPTDVLEHENITAAKRPLLPQSQSVRRGGRRPVTAPNHRSPPTADASRKRDGNENAVSYRRAYNIITGE